MLGIISIYYYLFLSVSLYNVGSCLRLIDPMHIHYVSLYSTTYHVTCLPNMPQPILKIPYIVDRGWNLLLIICGDIEENPGPDQSPLSQYLTEAKDNTELDTQNQAPSSEERGNSQHT